MLRTLSTAVLGAALALPLGAFAKTPVDQKAPEATLVAANEDAAVLVPAPRAEERPIAPAAERRVVPHGSSQSAADFRFTNPYAFPVQTLPISMPSISNFGGF